MKPSQENCLFIIHQLTYERWEGESDILFLTHAYGQGRIFLFVFFVCFTSILFCFMVMTGPSVRCN